MLLKALDLFCKAGGVTKGLKRGGFHWVVGVDIEPQPHYCGDEFICADVLSLGVEHIRQFDFVWASPPCQFHTSLKTAWNAKQHLDLIPQTRALLRAAGKPYIIENVVGAPLHEPITLCGTMFGLGIEGYELRRHRLFESSFTVPALRCAHSGGPVIGVYGDHVRSRGHWRKGADFPGCDKRALGSAAMGIDWMTWKELSQAIPPAYSEYIARQFILQLSQGSARSAG